jgi:hypothetical protein
MVWISPVFFAISSAAWPEEVGRSLNIPKEESESLVELLNTVDRSARTYHQHATASMDRRRFMGNNKDACQASGSPDTTNDDCNSLRWNLMSNFAPIYAAQKRADRALLLTEFEAEGLLDKTFNQLKANAQVIAGSDGSLAKPSKTNGLIFEADLMSKASKQLQGAAVASMSILYDQLMRVAQTATGDSNALKKNLASGLSNLMDQIKNATARQTGNANLNANRMVSQANAAMNASMTSVENQQKNSAGQVSALGSANDKSSSKFKSSAAQVKAKLSDAGDAIEGFDGQVQSQVEKASTEISSKIGSAVDAIVGAGDQSADQLNSQGKQISETLKSQTEGQLSDAQGSWSSAAQQASDRAQGLVSNVDGKIKSASEAVQSALSHASDSTASLIKGTQERISTEANEATKTARDASQTASKMSSQVTSQSQAAQSQTSQLQSDISAQQADSQKQLSALSSSAGSTTSEMMERVIKSVADTQNDAASKNEKTAATLQGAVADKLSGLGSDTNNVAGLLGGLRTGIASGESATSQALQSSFGETNMETEKAGSQLTGQLDGISASLTSTERNLQAGAHSVSGNVQGTLSAGANQALKGVAGLQRTNAATQAKLSQAVLGEAEKATGQSAGMSSSAHALLQALSFMESQTGSTEAALGSTQDSVDEAAEALFGNVGDASDDALNQIAGEVGVQKKKLNEFGSQFASEQSAQIASYWADVSSQLDQRKQASDKTATEAEAAESATLKKAEALKNIGHMLSSNLEELEGQNEDKSDSEHSNFLNKLVQLGGQDDAAVTDLTAQLKGYEGDAMQGIAEYLHSILGSENSEIGDTLSKQQAEINSMKGTSSNVVAEATRLQAALGALESDSSSSRDSLINKVLSILELAERGTGSFANRIDEIRSDLDDVKAGSARSLSELQNEIQAEILKIPAILTSGAAKLQNDFALASGDLENNILKLQEKLATAETVEEKEAAMQGLVVLNKLQGIQQGVAEADAKLRSQIESGAQQGIINSGNVQGAMSSVLAAMSSINSGMDSARLTVQADTETLGRQTATLVNGLNVMVNTSSDQLAQSASQSAMESRFNLNLEQARDKVRTASAAGGVRKTLSTFTNNANKAINDQSQISSEIETLEKTKADSRNALSGRLDEVLNAVTSNANKINSGAVEGQNDVLTRLALVRMAMAHFLGLWNEYAATMDRKLSKFHSADANFIAEMEVDLKGKLRRTEGNLNSTDSKIDALKQIIELGMSDEIQFENFFTTKVSQLRASLKAFNDDRNVKTMKANSMLSDFENLEAQSHASAMENIKSVIDEFDDGVLGHASKVDIFSGPTSLLEKQIRHVETEAMNSLAASGRKPFVQGV